VSGAGRTGVDWDAATYDRISEPQLAWAREQLERLVLGGDEVVLDAGCGSGRVTALIAERVPNGAVYGVDVAPSMVRHAREALGEGATILCQDLLELDLPEPVDAVFSNATFHWIADHARLFEVLRAAMRSGARLVAQCGGAGNIAEFRARADAVAGSAQFASYFRGWRGPWNYANAEQTAARLSDAGFEYVKTWLAPKPTPLADPRGFVETVCLVRHLDRLPPEVRRSFVDSVLGTYGDRPVVLQYMRLNMTASAR